jgi:hypothetical protein
MTDGDQAVLYREGSLDGAPLKHQTYVSEVRVELPAKVVDYCDGGQLTKEMLEEAVFQMAQQINPPQHYNARCETLKPETSQERSNRMKKQLDKTMRRNHLLHVVWQAVNELIADGLVDGDMHGTGHGAQTQGLDIKLQWDTPPKIVHPHVFADHPKEHSIALVCAGCGSTFVESYTTDEAAVHRHAQSIVDPKVVVCEACAGK